MAANRAAVRRDNALTQMARPSPETFLPRSDVQRLKNLLQQLRCNANAVVREVKHNLPVLRMAIQSQNEVFSAAVPDAVADQVAK